MQRVPRRQRPPKISYRTLRRWLAWQRNHAVPDQIDIAYLQEAEGVASESAGALHSALVVMGLLDGKNRPTPRLRAWLASPEGEVAGLREWGRHAFRPVLASVDFTAPEREVTLQLYRCLDAFPSGSRPHMIAFIRALLRDTGLAPSPAPRRPHPAEQPSAAALSQLHAPDTTEQERTFHLGSAGQIRLRAQVRWLELPDYIAAGLRRVIRMLSQVEHLAPHLEPTAPAQARAAAEALLDEKELQQPRGIESS